MLRIMAEIAIPMRISAAVTRIVATMATRIHAVMMGGTVATMTVTTTAAISAGTLGTMVAPMATATAAMAGTGRGAATRIAVIQNGAIITV